MKIVPTIPAGPPLNLDELRSRKDKEAVRAAAKEMEALFAYEMIKAMRETVKPADGGFSNEAYGSLFDMELARLFSERGLGLKEVLLKGLERGADIRDGENGGGGPALPPIPARRRAVDGPDSIMRETPAEGSLRSVPHVHEEEGSGGTALPVDGVISSGFGMRRHPVHGDIRHHGGMDIAAPAGTSIYAFRPGTVIFSGTLPGYGNTVIIDHGDGYTTKYAHNRINHVREGAAVGPGTVLAEVGSTGLSTGPHLHFEIQYEGKGVDPAPLIAMR